LAIDLEARAVKSVGAQLGEGPIWILRDSTLRFVDIKERRVYRFDPVSGELTHAVTPEQPGFVLPLRDGGFVVGCKNGLYRLDETQRTLTRIAEVEPHLPTNRLNDGCVGPDRAVWFGSMDDGETAASGSLYRCASGWQSTALDRDICITNGPAFSPDGRIFYHTDTMNRVVHAFDHTVDGKLTSKRVFLTIEKEAGWPDGTTVDSEGCVWIALWGGWGVRRYSPAGELLGTVRFPCANITKIAFGGDDLRTVYATSAWKGLSAAERAAQPLAGDLFTFRADAPGMPSPEAVLNP
jgi:sugar lactone lactonase YvrE